MHKRLGLLASLFILAASAPAFAQPSTAACRPQQDGQVNYQACADAAPSGSSEQRWALINLGTQAFLKRDYGRAAGFYDAAAAEGKKVYSDANFHAFRAETYKQVGRLQDAVADAKLAYAILTDGEGVPADALKAAREQPVEESIVYAIVVPILHDAEAPQAAAATRAYLAMPTDGHVGKMANRALTLSAIGEHSSAVAESERAVALAANDADLLNNHCEILRVAGRAADALPFCDRALAIAPQAASTHHTRAGVLAALGRCEDSRRALEDARRFNTVGRMLDPIGACVPTAN